jgi:hypothetical protein
MKNITSTAELKNAILLIEAKRDFNGQLLKVQFNQAYERFKPVNLLRSAMNDVTSSHSTIVDNIVIPAIGIGAGYLSKKIVAGSSDNKYRILIGSILQSEVTTLIVQNPDAIKAFGQYIFRLIFRKKDINSQNH